jgi:hypothetical protein
MPAFARSGWTARSCQRRARGPPKAASSRRRHRPAPCTLDTCSRECGTASSGGKDYQCGEQASNPHGPMPPGFKPGASPSSAIAACRRCEFAHPRSPSCSPAGCGTEALVSRCDAVAHGKQRELKLCPLDGSRMMATARPDFTKRSHYAVPIHDARARAFVLLPARSGSVPRMSRRRRDALAHGKHRAPNRHPFAASCTTATALPGFTTCSQSECR